MARRATFEEVVKRFNINGFDLLEINFKNSRTPMKCRCKKHKDVIQNKTFASLGVGEGCKYCGWESSAEKRKHDFNKVKEIFAENDLELLEQEYVNQSQKLKCICRKHADKVLEMSYLNVSMGHGCKYCAYEDNREKLKGENNGYFKGGVSPLNIILRDSLNEWREEILKKYNYRCCISGEKRNLEIHHIKSFHEIRDEVLRELGFEARFKRSKWLTMDFTNDEIELIKKEVVKKHTLELGAPLTKELHKKFHNEYGRKATEEDFIEFKNKRMRHYLKRGAF